MKKQLLKKLFAFIIMMMFSVSLLHAQCKGNKVYVCHISRTGDYYICKCVPPGQVTYFTKKGWNVSSSSGFAPSNNKTPKRRAGKTPANNAVLAKK